MNALLFVVLACSVLVSVWAAMNRSKPASRRGFSSFGVDPATGNIVSKLEEIVPALTLAAAAGLCTGGCADAIEEGPKKSADQIETGSADDLAGAEGGAGGVKADGVGGCDCAPGRHCVAGSCADAETWHVDQERPVANNTDIAVTATIDRARLNVAYQKEGVDNGRSGLRTRLYGANSDGAGFRKVDEFFSSWNVPRIHEPPKFLDTGADRPVYVHQHAGSLRYEPEIDADYEGLDIGKPEHFDALQTSEGLVVAVAHRKQTRTDSAERGTWVWRESTGRMTMLDDDLVDELEIIELDGGELRVLYRDNSDLHLAAPGLDAWNKRRVTEFPSIVDEGSRDYHLKAVAHRDHVHVVIFTRAEDHYDNVESRVEHFRLEDGEIEQRQTIGRGEWRLDGGRYERGGGVRKIASDIALDGDGNVYVLNMQLIGDDGRRETRLVKVAPDGTVTESRVANWTADSYNRDPFNYAMDVSREGNIVVAGFEMAEKELHVRLFDTAGK